MVAVRCRIAASLTLFAVLVGVATCRGNLIVDGLNTGRHERFANDAAFVGSIGVAGFELDFSGVARGTNGFWATMISTTHFVSANHAHASGNVVFYHSNDPAGPTTERTILGGSRIGGTDIWVGELNAPIDPMQVAIYSIAADADYTDDIFYQVGRGPLQGSDNTTGFRVGRNRVSGVYEDVVLGSAVTDSLVYFDDSPAGDFIVPKEGTADLIEDETFLQGGDSGGPSFLLSVTGELILLGTHSFITLQDDELGSPFHDRRASGDAHLPAYQSAILLAAVPEASPLLAVPLVVVLVGLTRRIKRIA